MNTLTAAFLRPFELKFNWLLMFLSTSSVYAIPFRTSKQINGQAIPSRVSYLLAGVIE
jgi:hypothetical protein